MSKYNEVMNKVEVTPDMKSRILQNLAKELAEAEGTSENISENTNAEQPLSETVTSEVKRLEDGQKTAGAEKVVDINEAGKAAEAAVEAAPGAAKDIALEMASRKRNRVAAFKRYGAMAATFAVLFVGVAAVMRMQGGKLSSTAPMYDSAPAYEAEAPATEEAMFEAEADYAAEAPAEAEEAMFEAEAVEEAAEAPADAEYAAEATESAAEDAPVIEEANSSLYAAKEAETTVQDKDSQSGGTDSLAETTGNSNDTLSGEGDSLAKTGSEATLALGEATPSEADAVQAQPEAGSAVSAKDPGAMPIVILLLSSILMLALFAGAIIGITFLIRYIVKAIKRN